MSCSSNGTCNCTPGVTATKCDQCLPFHFDLSSSGCQRCSECEVSLNMQLYSTLPLITEIQNYSDLFQQLMIEDGASDSLINSSITALSVKQFTLFFNFNKIETSLHVLNETDLNLVFQFSLRTQNEVCIAKAHKIL